MPDWRADLFRPPFSAGMIAMLLAAVAVGGLLLYLRRQDAAGAARRTLLVLLRGAALSALTWLLMGPTLLDQTPPASVRLPLWILADTSASMAQRDAVLPGRADPASRWDALRTTWLSDESLAAFADAADLRLRRFDDRVSPLSAAQVAALQPSGKETHLLSAVEQIIQTPSPTPPTIVLLSDGHDTQRPAADAALLERLGEWGGRIYVVPVGHARTVPDIAVQAWPDADFLYDRQSTTIRATLLQRHYGDRRARVELLHEGRLLEVREVAFDGQPMRKLEFRVTPQADPRQPVTVHGYQVRATILEPGDAEPVAAAEAYLDNNTRPVFLQVSRERIRVLLLEGEPYWDTRYLAQALRQDPQVELTALFDLGEGRQLQVASPQAAGSASPEPGPLDQAALNDYDVVILGKSIDRLLPDAAVLVSYVQQRGGALVLARGRPYEAAASSSVLAPILPVVWGEGAVEQLALELTPEGARSPLLQFDGAGPPGAVLTRLPGMIAATRIARERAASIVLLRQTPAQEQTTPMAAIAHQRAGAGRVMAVLTDGLWRWALLPSALDEYGSIYELFWSRAIRWLATGGEFLPGREVSMTLDRLVVEPGDPVGVTVATRFIDPGYQPIVRLTAPDGTRQTLQPQPVDARGVRYRASFRPDQSGVYHLELDRPAAPGGPPVPPITARLAAFERSTERLDPSAHPQVLHALADATGGASLDLDEGDVLLAHLRSLRAARASDVRPAYDFDRPWVLAVIIGCFGMEWFLRRRAGLL